MYRCTPADPANSYERSRPEDQPGQGRLDNNKATPTDQPSLREFYADKTGFKPDGFTPPRLREEG
jgi:hypothetical protein